MAYPFLAPLYALMTMGSGTVALPARSDPVGVYALVDKVVFEGDAANPRAVQIWGVFSLPGQSGGIARQPAQRGYLYYTVNTSNDRASRAEWADLEAVAGTGTAVGFGARFTNNGRIRPRSEAVANPDVYPLGVGVTKLPSQYTQPREISDQAEHELRGIPDPVTPAEGTAVPAGAAHLAVRNAALAGVQYFFEIKGPGAEIETSAAIAAGAAQTAWTPRMQLRAGTTYTWRVWTVEGSWHSQSASASFKTN